MNLQEYDKTLHFLYALQRFGIKVGLQDTQMLLKFLGNPERRFPCIHIAGTNGKGSTASMIASILTASGYRTGLYTSPHLITFNERIRIDGKKISDNAIVEYTRVLKPTIQKLRATFFEATTAMAFKYFADREVDIAVIETGLGGRLDATNVVTPILSIITSIGIDHTEHLGGTISKIAFEKGGIIKKSVPCVTATRNPSALSTLKRSARIKRARLIDVDKISSATILKRSLEGSWLNFTSNSSMYDNLFISLAGDHQVENARLALVAAEVIKTRCGDFTIPRKAIAKGMAEIRTSSGLRGRLDVLRTSPLTIADVAHNPDGIQHVIDAVHKLIGRKLICVFGVMSDKDYGAMISVLASQTRMIVAVQPELERALGANIIVSELHSRGVKAYDGGSVAQGLNIAFNEVRATEVILVTGSHYVVGEAFKSLNIKV
ncbi:MAG: bifunctional folylpolyglutamate synthase/dihydrofolate synthase [Ignavibacteriae bacterium]|nr:bifunctional folylpolyglutamate synthase/dihydrofolate synthase [Ignavibacteriota bacterium]